VRRGWRRDEIVDWIRERFGIGEEKWEKVGRYWHEPETGLVPISGISARLHEALAERFGEPTVSPDANVLDEEIAPVPSYRARRRADSTQDRAASDPAFTHQRRGPPIQGGLAFHAGKKSVATTSLQPAKTQNDARTIEVVPRIIVRVKQALEVSIIAITTKDLPCGCP
jgi:hypothetical protein